MYNQIHIIKYDLSTMIQVDNSAQTIIYHDKSLLHDY